MSRKIGFTLAEILITLTVIGVVAALTIPTLLQNTQQAEIKVAWKKAFGNVKQAYMQAVNDHGTGFGAYGDTAHPNGVAKMNAIMSKMNVIKTCNGNTFGNCWAPGGVSYDNPAYNIPGYGGLFSIENQNGRMGFVTNDGMCWIIYNDNYAAFAIDLNGFKPPNKWGHDVLNFFIDDTDVRPAADNAMKYLYE